MHKRLKLLIKNIKEIFSIQFLDRLSKKSGFVKRKSKLNAETFLSFNTFLSSDMCDKSLSTLCGRLAAQLSSVKRDRGKINDRSVAWTAINVYITNVPEKILATEQIHDVYSLRWQIEIMFKIWKSIFNIHNVKNVK